MGEAGSIRSTCREGMLAMRPIRTSLTLGLFALVAALMAGAIAMHIKVADPFKKSLPALAMLTLSLLMVFGRWSA